MSVYLLPAVCETLLPKIAEKSPGEVYLNPGAESAAIRETGRRLGLNLIEACSIVAIGKRPVLFPD